MITLNDRFDDIRCKKGEPFGEALALSDLGHRRYSANDQIVEPAMRPSDGFQKSKVSLPRSSLSLFIMSRGSMPRILICIEMKPGA
jgi:hypothetical protein